MHASEVQVGQGKDGVNRIELAGWLMWTIRDSWRDPIIAAWVLVEIVPFVAMVSCMGGSPLGEPRPQNAKRRKDRFYEP